MNKVIPIIGESGFYELAEPFTTPKDEIYTCKAIRTISEYISLNQDPFKEFYESKGIDIEIFNNHMKLDIEIISLVSDGGFWIHVPSTHLLRYPNMNGIAYRTVALVVKLPAFSVEQKFDHVESQIKDIARQSLGVDCEVETVITSKTKLVDSGEHINLQIGRRRSMAGSTPTSRALYWQGAYEALKRQYDSLVDHFKSG